MKHIKTYESFINESINESETFKVGDLVRVYSKSSSAPKLVGYGVLTKVNKSTISYAVLGTGKDLNGDQPDKSFGGLKNGMSAEEIKKLPTERNIGSGYKKSDVTLWVPNIKSLDESLSMGSKAKRFSAAVGDLVDFFVDAEKKENGKLPAEYNNALKTLGISKQDAAVCFSETVGDWETIVDAAKKAGIKYEEVDDKETGAKAIVFSAKL